MAVTLPIGFNFRGSSGYVTDVSPDVFSNGHYDSGVGYGWNDVFDDIIDNGGGSDRNSGINARLAGSIHWNNGLSEDKADFRVDLPAAGTYDIRGAFGDATFNANGGICFRIYDDTTLLFTVDDANFYGGGQWMDATGVLRTSASDWITNNAAKQLTFTSNIMRVTLGGAVIAGGGDAFLAHLDIAAVGGGNATVPVTGNSATGSVGTTTRTITTNRAVTGNAATGSTGTMVPTIAKGVTGQAGTGATGTVAIRLDDSISVTGQAATGSVGTVAKLVQKPITGNTATGAVGTPTINAGGSISAAVTGNAATGAVGTVAITLSSSASITGQAASGQVGSASVTVPGSSSSSSSGGGYIKKRTKTREERATEWRVTLGKLMEAEGAAERVATVQAPSEETPPDDAPAVEMPAPLDAIDVAALFEKYGLDVPPIAETPLPSVPAGAPVSSVNQVAIIALLLAAA